MEQYNILKEEVAKFSEELSKRKFAIALTKIDAINPDELNGLVEQFIKDVGLDVVSENDFGFDKKKKYYIQDLTFNKYNDNLPYFILPNTMTFLPTLIFSPLTSP